jgi:rubredoxin
VYPVCAGAVFKRFASGYKSRSMKRWRCTVCDHIYDPAEGDPVSGVAPGTPFEKLPADWSCPDCGATKADFEEMSN